MLSVWPDAVFKALVCSIHVTLMVLCVAWEMISCLLHPALITLFPSLSCYCCLCYSVYFGVWGVNHILVWLQITTAV